MKKEPLYSILPLVHDLYGVELDEDTFETYALSAWNKIGNKDYRIKLIKVKPKCEPCSGEWFVCKPCDLDKIEAITLNFEDAQETDSVINFPGEHNHAIELEIENKKRIRDELYISGKYIKYKELGDKIYFSEPYPELNLLYKALYVDENGLPFVNEREKNAIALYCAYAYYNKLAIMTKDNLTMLTALMIYKQYLRAMDLARIDDNLSQNDYNLILNLQVSWHRHNYGRTSKPIF